MKIDLFEGRATFDGRSYDPGEPECDPDMDGKLIDEPANGFSDEGWWRPRRLRKLHYWLNDDSLCCKYVWAKKSRFRVQIPEPGKCCKVCAARYVRMVRNASGGNI